MATSTRQWPARTIDGATTRTPDPRDEQVARLFAWAMWPATTINEVAAPGGVISP